MLAQAVATLLADSHGLPVWRVLDTGFSAARLLTLWQAWRDMANPPLLLHLVVVSSALPSADDLKRSIGPLGGSQLITELDEQWQGLLPGFHRLSLAEGRFLLTLCLGELQPMLRELGFEADSIWFDSTQLWNRWSLQALARCCRRGTQLISTNPPALPQGLLTQAGFHCGNESTRYDPPWTVRNRNPKPAAAVPGDCAVIGAGLAGAAVAAALARRGWRVSVFDAATAPAAGASSLPVGLLVPHVSGDDSPRSRLSRAGLRLVRQQAQRLLKKGQDWAPSGVLERRVDRSLGLPDWWPQQDQDLSQPAQPIHAPWHAQTIPGPELWHPQAAWIKPAALVLAWLSTEGVRFIGQSDVDRLQRLEQGWQLLDCEKRVLGRASHVVLANAAKAPHLLVNLKQVLPLPPLQAVGGQLSFGLRQSIDSSMLPPFPVNGLGSLIPTVPTPQGLAWFAGATYEDPLSEDLPTERAHRENFDKLRQLLPATASALEPYFMQARVQSWAGLRCVSPDRLPLVGPLEKVLHPSLWVNLAMGSRGLNFSFLCAELLAARLAGEPLPVENSIARCLEASRFSPSSAQQ